MMKKATDKNRLIIRVDNSDRNIWPLIQGYSVRVYRSGVKFNRFFSDKAYGGKRKALYAARELRDKMEPKIPCQSKAKIATTPTARNTSGTRGVRLRITKITRGGKTYVYEHVEAAWSSEGKVMKKNFSVAALGVRGAWRSAKACRTKALAELFGAPSRRLASR